MNNNWLKAQINIAYTNQAAKNQYKNAFLHSKIYFLQFPLIIIISPLLGCKSLYSFTALTERIAGNQNQI